jgi:hypothetical protein
VAWTTKGRLHVIGGRFDHPVVRRALDEALWDAGYRAPGAPRPPPARYWPTVTPAQLDELCRAERLNR